MISRLLPITFKNCTHQSQASPPHRSTVIGADQSVSSSGDLLIKSFALSAQLNGLKTSDRSRSRSKSTSRISHSRGQSTSRGLCWYHYITLLVAKHASARSRACFHFGKRSRESVETASDSHSNSRRLFVTESVIETIFPYRYWCRHFSVPCTLCISQASWWHHIVRCERHSNQKWSIYGFISSSSLDFRLRRDFKWRFIVADVTHPIVGADFLLFFGLMPDLKNGRLIILSSFLQFKYWNWKNKTLAIKKQIFNGQSIICLAKFICNCS